MELWQLRTFSVVAKTLHFTRAAEELNLSQPAVSHQIKSLESEIGEPLFLREKDGILLTKAGQTMFQHANKILDIANEMKQEIRENREALSGRIILGGTTRGLSNPFPIFYREFKKNYSDIDIFFQAEKKLEQIVEKVREGKVDIGIVSHNLDLSGLVAIPYSVYELIVVSGKEHPLANRDEITKEELKQQKWVLFELGNRIRSSEDDYFEKLGIKPKDIYESNDGAVIKSSVIYDNRLSLLPEWGVFEELKDGRLRKIKVKDTKYTVQLNLIWKANRRTKIMSTVLSFIIEGEMEGLQPIKSEDKK